MVTVVMSEGFLELSGYEGMDKKEIYDLVDSDIYRLVHPDDLASVGDAVDRFLTESGVFDVIYRQKRYEEYRVVHLCGRHIYKEDGTRLAVIWYTDQGVFVGGSINENEVISAEYARLQQDVTDAMRIKREYTEKLALVQNMAEIDSLTGIKNKNAYKVREGIMNQ
ncbi:MAG: PAS domain-containing protein, partial [Butyrivibrio sp.]|nr:PAS domain-containing protein [Butyrivibrio sp.]